MSISSNFLFHLAFNYPLHCKCFCLELLLSVFCPVLVFHSW